MLLISNIHTAKIICDFSNIVASRSCGIGNMFSAEVATACSGITRHFDYGADRGKWVCSKSKFQNKNVFSFWKAPIHGSVPI